MEENSSLEATVAYKLLMKYNAFDKFVNNFIDQEWLPYHKKIVSEYQEHKNIKRLLCRIGKNPIGSAFSWLSSYEGADYWCKIYNEFCLEMLKLNPLGC